MKLGNVALLCKGWYKMRDNNRLDIFWMDMAHAINADGWTMRSKHDVVGWCMRRLDDMRDNPKLVNYKNQFKFSILYDNINGWIRRASWSNMELSQEDAIIWVYRDIVSNLNNECFDERLKPDRRVLPINLNEAWYDNGRYGSKGPKLYPAEMMCDYIEKVNNIMPDAKDQDIREDEYDWVEGFLKKESWKDVQIELGEDNLNDCIEVECTALDLKNQTFSDLGHIELGKFDNCKDLIYCENPIKKLIVRLYKKITHYENIDWEDDITYYLKSIREK